MIRRARILLCGLLLALASAGMLVSVFSSRYSQAGPAGYSPVRSDETVLAWVSKETAAGRVPYRDFFTFIPPLTLYGLASFFKAAGASLGALRLLSVAWLLLVTLLVYALMVRWRVPPPWAAGAALSFPALYLPFWPVPSHHWFAAGFGLLALFVISGERTLARHWAAAGALAGLSGLCLQTEGAVVCGLLFLRWALQERAGRGRAALAAMGGVAAPLALFALILWLEGALPHAYACLVQWPARYYKQPGGFNDVNFAEFLSGHWLSSLPASPGLAGWLPALSLSLAYALPLLALASVAASGAWVSPDARPARPWLFSAGGLVLVGLAYLGGRQDWTHVLFWIPLLVPLALHNVAWDRERWRPAACKAWILLVFAMACVRWPALWIETPPRIGEILGVDELVRSRSVPALLPRLPGVLDHDLPVLYLSMHGSSLYFYWAPLPPPVDWLQPPSMRYNAPEDYERIARFAQEHRIPYILVSENEYRKFAEEPSAVAELLRTRYRPYQKSPWGIVLVRKADGPGPR